MINKKKIFFYSFIILINYLLLTAIIFSFSYISLIKGKTYNWFWVKSVQKKIYFRGYRNIFHFSEDCINFDKYLLYKPKSGICEFSNVEFNTSLTFDEFIRKHDSKIKDKIRNDYVVVLGDSIAMGWGVNDNETFSYYLENLLKKRVFNMGVSSYGTTREIKKLKNSPYYNDQSTIVIQYHRNDIYENRELNINKIYSKEEFNSIFDFKKKNPTNIKFILRNYKSSIRLFFSDIFDIIFKEQNIELMNFNDDKKYLEELIKKNFDLTKNRLIVIIPLLPWQKVINVPRNNEIEYLFIKLKKKHYFTIDDHPNAIGHKEIAKKIYDYLNENQN